MKNRSMRWKWVVLCLAVCLGLAAAPVLAETQHRVDESSSAAAMGADLLLARPLGLVATVVGTGLFVVSMPFAAIGGNVDEAAHALVVAPGAYTFDRPLGVFNGDESGY